MKLSKFQRQTFKSRSKARRKKKSFQFPIQTLSEPPKNRLVTLLPVILKEANTDGRGLGKPGPTVPSRLPDAPPETGEGTLPTPVTAK